MVSVAPGATELLADRKVHSLDESQAATSWASGEPSVSTALPHPRSERMSNGISESLFTPHDTRFLGGIHGCIGSKAARPFRVDCCRSAKAYRYRSAQEARSRMSE